MKMKRNNLTDHMQRFYPQTGGIAGVQFDEDQKFQGDWVTPKTMIAPPKTHGGPCSDSHPALKIPGTPYVIYGGSCINPFVTDADVYIGFDHAMQLRPQRFPWGGSTDVLFEIQDMAAPKSPKQFKALVDWTIEQLQAGRKVHAGCIGGHGRTGTFFAALVASMAPQEPDAIAYVRKHYCAKAIETAGQIEFLRANFGVKHATGSKSKPKVGAVIAGAVTRITAIMGSSIWD